jgi:hypothetical protein
LTSAQRLIYTTDPEPFARGLDYLYGVRSLALEPELVGLVHDPQARVPICTWIGTHIEGINQKLEALLQLCHNCCLPEEQPDLQIFAAPLTAAFGVDALCNLDSQPKTIIVDVGRVVPKHWLLLVAHEYAHARVGVPGHHPQFVQSLTHLCLGLGIIPQIIPANIPENNWRSFPPCLRTADPLAFWRGD